MKTMMSFICAGAIALSSLTLAFEPASAAPVLSGVHKVAKIEPIAFRRCRPGTVGVWPHCRPIRHFCRPGTHGVWPHCIPNKRFPPRPLHH